VNEGLDKIALGFAAVAWCEPETKNHEMDPVLATAMARRVIQPLLEGIEAAWGIIANAQGGISSLTLY
jgi:hypothetical protein